MSEPLVDASSGTAPDDGWLRRGSGTGPLRGGQRRLWDATSSRGTPRFPGYRRRPPQSDLIRVQRGNPVEVRAPVTASGRPTVRNAQLLGGNRRTQKRTPAAERRRENETRMIGSFRRSSRITGRIRALPGLERVLTWVWWACDESMISSARTDGHVGRRVLDAVNGPEGERLDWLSVDWRRVEREVRRLRQRIFTASRDGDLKQGPQPAEADAPLAR